MIRLETERLLLRPWEARDAQSLYEYAKDPRVGPSAGWRAHTSVENSAQIICDVLSAPQTCAIVLKATGQPIGSIGFHHNDLAAGTDEAELGYWLGVPYWGTGIVTEAAKEMLRYAFEELNLNRVWCGYYDGNEKSKRVQEKLGFRYQWTSETVPVPQLGETRKGHVNLLTKEQWQAGRRTLVLYLHGQGGSPEEAGRYEAVFPRYSVLGLPYTARTPREAQKELPRLVEELLAAYGPILLLANSIGAYFAMCAHLDRYVRKAYFISPVVDLRGLIADRMRRCGVTEEELAQKKTICTPEGWLSWDDYRFVSSLTLSWNAPSEILCGEKDELTPIAATRAFSEKIGARLTVMEGGEHRFHTEAQMRFLDKWLKRSQTPPDKETL